MAISLKAWLDSNPRPNAPAGFLALPEVGDGVQVALRRLTLGEFRAIMAEQRDGAGDGLDKIARVLPRCVCEDDGSPWSGPDLTAVLSVAECGRIISECLKANSVDVIDAKKASPPTP